MPAEIIEGSSQSPHTPDQYLFNGRWYPTMVFDKYKRNIKGGIQAISANMLKEFTGYPDGHYDGIGLRGFFSEESAQVLRDRVIDPVKSIAARYGIPLYPAGDLWTPHVTIADLRYNKKTPGSRNEVFASLAKHSRVTGFTDRSVEMEVTFDTLFGGSAIALAAAQLPPEILSMRQAMSQVAVEYEMGEKDLSNIVHASIGRLGNTQGISSDTLNLFARDLLHLHHGIVREPLHVTLNRVELMSNQQTEQVHEQQLFDQLKLEA